MNKIDIAFEVECLMQPISHLVPSKLITPGIKYAKKFRRVAESINEVGIVEPLVVYPVQGKKSQYLVLDGNLRLEALKDLGWSEAPCLISKDDEAFTYNKHLNRLNSVQEHHMILRAIKNGVSEARIARALGIKVASIRRKSRLLEGICPEVVAIFKNAQFSSETSAILRRLKPVRQIEVAELMRAMNNFTVSYAKALFLATQSNQLVDPDEKKPVRGITTDEHEHMEQEMESLRRDIKAVEENYGAHMLLLVVANGFVGRILGNSRISKYVGRNHPDIFNSLTSLQESIDGDMGVAAE